MTYLYATTSVWEQGPEGPPIELTRATQLLRGVPSVDLELEFTNEYVHSEPEGLIVYRTTTRVRHYSLGERMMPLVDSDAERPSDIPGSGVIPGTGVESLSDAEIREEAERRRESNQRAGGDYYGG